MLHNIQQWLNITDCMKKLHFAHFGRKLATKPSHEHLIQFDVMCQKSLSMDKKRKSFGIPMVWEEPQNNFDDWLTV